MAGLPKILRDFTIAGLLWHAGETQDLTTIDVPKIDPADVGATPSAEVPAWMKFGFDPFK